MRRLKNNPNVNNSDPVNYPDARIQDNNGSGNGTFVNERTSGDIFQTISRLMRLYDVTPNDLPDNVTNGFQIVESLVALASKNDYVLTLTIVGGVITVPLKLNFVNDNETFICQTNFNLGAQTQIKGTGTTLYTATFQGQFLANEYVRLTKTSLGIVVVRLADDVSLNAMILLLNFLKKATTAQEIAGILDTVGTTPQSNALAFVERVNGLASAQSLANLLRNGLYPKEHFSIVANLGASPVKNVGWFSGWDVGVPGVNLPVSGQIVSASVTFGNQFGSIVLVTVQNAMANLNYVVKIFCQSESPNMRDSTEIGTVIFKPISTTQFEVSAVEFTSRVQSLKVHLEVVQL